MRDPSLPMFARDGDAGRIANFSRALSLPNIFRGTPESRQPQRTNSPGAGVHLFYRMSKEAHARERSLTPVRRSGRPSWPDARFIARVKRSTAKQIKVPRSGSSLVTAFLPGWRFVVASNWQGVSVAQFPKVQLRGLSAPLRCGIALRVAPWLNQNRSKALLKSVTSQKRTSGRQQLPVSPSLGTYQSRWAGIGFTDTHPSTPAHASGIARL